MRRGWDVEAVARLPFVYEVKQTSMRHPAHITSAADEQQSSSSFGLMIRLLLVLPLLLFHAGAMAALNNPPSISLAGILSAYTEGDGTKTPASDVTITAGDSGSPNFTATEIQSASVFINVGYQSSEDVLAFPNANGITGSWNSSTAVLSLTASSPLPSIATWEQALESVTYQNTSDDPSTNLRSFRYSVTDSLAGQNNALANFSVIAVNDAPVIGSQTGTTVLENSGNTSTSIGSVTATDADDPSLTYLITNGNASGFFTIDPSTGNITLTTAGVAEVNQDNLVTTTYTLEITVEDDETPTPASTSTTLDVTFEAVNDPPTVSASSIFVDEGATFTLTNTEIFITDADDNLSDVNIAISNVSSTLSIQIAGSPVTSFTAQQLTDGDVSLVHDGSEDSSAFFDLTVEDGDEDLSTPSTQSVFVSVTPVNDTPVIDSQTGTTVLENSGNTSTSVGSVMATDADDPSLTYSITSGNASGFFTIDPSTGNITLTTAGAVEVNQDNLVTTTYTLEITVEDDETPTPASTTTPLDVTFEAVNDPPILSGSSLFMDEGETITLTTTEIFITDADDNLSDVNIAISNLSSTLSIQIAGSSVTSFTAQQLTDGDVSLVHDGSEIVTASFELTPEDGDEDSSTPTTETLFVSVNQVNDPPTITDVGGTLAYTEEGPAAIIDATITISDAENDQIQSATITISSGYEPSEDALNFDSASASPLGITGSFVSATLTLSGGSSAANYETILESVTYQNSNAINPSTTNRAITWTVNDGLDSSVAATSTITVTAVDDPSVFSGDISGSGLEDTSISGTLTVTDPEGIASPNFTIDAQASSGSASIVSSSGLWQYTPDLNYSGTDSFTVKVTDDLGNTATQAISLTVTPVDDAPVAENATLTVLEDAPATSLGLSAPSNPDSGETLTITISQVPGAGEGIIANGSTTLAPSNVIAPSELAGLTFTPNTNYDGAVADFVYLLSDGTGNDDSTGAVSISITAVDDPPIAENKSLTVAEDSPGTNLGLLEPTTPDPGETLAITVTQVPLPSEGVINNSGTSLSASSTLTPSELAALKFIPATDYDGTVTDFSYSLSDGTGSDSSNGTVSITITPVDDPPVAESKSVTVNEDSPGTNLGLLTPTTPDTGETLNITINQVPTAGEGIISNAGIPLAVSNAITPSELAGLSFVPNSNYDGTVTDFVYTLSDATGNDDSQGTVTITITPQNDFPVAIDDVFATNEGAILAGSVAANDTEGDGPSTYSLAVDAMHGALALSSDGSFSYTPTAGFSGSDSFEYDLTDVDNELSSAFVTLTIVAVTAVDTDGDGIADEVDAYPTIDLGALIDSDGDGAPNACDSSCQSLGMAVDAFPNNANEWLDTDSDGLGNNSDTDDDGDGISDAQDDFPLDASEATDTDDDGIGDNADLDDDNDGVVDTSDPFPQDTDDDGNDNAFDLDDDNDGVLDNLDLYPLTSVLGFLPDNDADGAPDNCDSTCIAAGLGADPDDDNDGVPDVTDDLPFNYLAAIDTDGDGYPDEYLATSLTALGGVDLSLDSLFLNAAFGGIDAFPSNQGEWRDSDSDGIGDNADLDDDNDGVIDGQDIMPVDPNWSVPVSATASEGAQLITRLDGALTNPDINFEDLRNGATFEFGPSGNGQFIDRFGTTPFTWETDSEGWLSLEGDLSDPSHQEVFEVRVSALGDLITVGLMNTLALDPSYAATTFEVREMVADLRLIKIGDRSDLIEVYAAELTYGYYIVDTGLRTQVLQEMLIQQPERVDSARELILGFTFLEALSFLRGDIAPAQPSLTDNLPFGGTQTVRVLPNAFGGIVSTSALTQFPTFPQSLQDSPFDDLADWDTQLAVFSSGGQGTFEGILECAFTWTDNTNSIELTITQVPSEPTCINAGTIHSITSLPTESNGGHLLYIRSTSAGETSARLILSRTDSFGSTFDPANIQPLLTSEKALVSGAQLSNPNRYTLDSTGNPIFNIGAMDAVVLKNDGTISPDNIPIDGTAKVIDSITPGGNDVEDWQWFATTEGIGFIDPNGSGTVLTNVETGETTPVPDITWRVLDYDSEGRLWVLETEFLSSSITEANLTFFTVLAQDQDGDLEADLDEFVANRDPFTFDDADGDGLSDANETNNIGTDPNDSDSDNDGALDGLDIDPISPELSGIDANLDGIDDAWASTFYANGINPTDDLDGDSLTVLEEYVSDTSDANFNLLQTISAPELRLRPNRVTRIPLSYSTSDGDQNLPGLGLRIHFHSSDLALVKFEAASAYLNGLIEINNVWAPDTFNLDANFFTDHYIEISWSDQANGWPNETLPINLGNLLVAPRSIGQSGDAEIDFSPSALAGSYGLSAPSLTLNYSLGQSFDFDEDGDVTALSDGLMMLRFLFGFSSDFSSLIGENSPHIGNPGVITQRLNEHLSVMDIDDDGSTQALTDGLLLIRYLFGFRGDSLIEGATGQGANRASAADIQAYLDQFIHKAGDNAVTPSL